MATKIGYVSQPPAAQINWAEVGANFTTMLNEEARVREEKKAEIDRATREQMRVLQETPMGDSANMNQWALNYSSEAQKQLLMLNKMLKSGKLKPSDYTLIRQNLADGTDQAFTLVQEYQNEYADKMERLKSENPGASSQYLEQYLMETAEGFGNFNKSQLVINPTTGEVLVGFKNENGELESDPNKLIGINNLRNRIKAKYDKYDMDSAVQKAKQSFGKFESLSRTIGTRNREGTIIKYSDPTMRTESYIKQQIKEGKMTAEEGALLSTYDQAEDAWLEGQLSSYNVTSLLTDNLRNIGGKKFKFTSNPDEQDENTILLKQVDGNVVPDFESEIGKKQREIAKDGLRTVLRGALDHTQDVKTVNDYTYIPPTYAPEWYYNMKQEKKDLNNSVSMISKLYTGTGEDATAAVNYFLSNRQGITGVTRDSKGVTVEYKNPDTGKNETRTLPFFTPNGILLSQEEFIKQAGPLLTGQKDISTALAKGGYDKNAIFNSSTTPYIAKVTESSNQPTSGAYNGKSYLYDVNELVNKKVGWIDFGGKANHVEERIKELFGKDLPEDALIINPGGERNQLDVRVKGFPSIKIDANNWTQSGKESEANKLKKYLLETLSARYSNELATKYNWSGTDVTPAEQQAPQGGQTGTAADF